MAETVVTLGQLILDILCLPKDKPLIYGEKFEANTDI